MVCPVSIVCSLPKITLMNFSFGRTLNDNQLHPNSRTTKIPRKKRYSIFRGDFSQIPSYTLSKLDVKVNQFAKRNLWHALLTWIYLCNRIKHVRTEVTGCIHIRHCFTQRKYNQHVLNRFTIRITYVDRYIKLSFKL